MARLGGSRRKTSREAPWSDNHGHGVSEREVDEAPRIPPLILLLGGLALVYAGATILVDGGIRVLHRTSLTAGFVGAALIGALAALDEVLLEVLGCK